MRFSTIASSLLASVAFVQTATAANATDVKNQLAVISSYTKLLTSDVGQYTDTVHTLAFALQVQEDSVNLYRAVNTGTKIVNSISGQFPEPDSLEIGLTLLSLSSTVEDTLTAVSNKSSAFSYLGPIVLATLYSLKNATDVFAGVTVAKLQGIEAAIAPGVVTQLDGSFNSAIEAYGGKGKDTSRATHA